MSSNTLRQKQSGNIASGFEFVQTVAKVTGGTLLGITMLTSSIVAGGLVGLAISFRNLPDVRVLRTYAPTETTHIYGLKGDLLTSVHGEANREVVPLNRISPELKRAVLAIEDSHFYFHHGINPSSVGRAVKANWQKGDVVEGGSTLTMQLVKNLFLSHKRAFSRKVAEAVLAIRLEQILTKDQIMELYLNQVYWGHNNYGVETAAESYFGKSAAKLNLAEASMMAGLIQAPEEYSPFINYKVAKQRQALVLSRMRELAWITPAQEAAARKQPLKLGKVTSFQTSQLPYVTDAVKQELIQRFGRDAVQKGGMRVQTTIDTNFQRMAEEFIAREHWRLQRRGLWKTELALVAVDPRTHFVKAMVGGSDYEKSQFNRAIQARRQPGSAFKPFVYYAAFATGRYTPYSTVYDTPVSYRDGDGWYRPRNYDNSFGGAMSIRAALEVSRNIPAVKLGRAVGLDKVIEVCRTLGIKSPMEPVTSLPLGAIGLTPLEMASAYATFAANGWQSDTTFIVQVTDTQGQVILDNTPKPKLVLDPWAAASMNSVLRSVVVSGTGKEAQIGRPAAGKTGTTSAERDVWFVGYVPQLSVAIWVGRDDNRRLAYGVTGGQYAAPIWRNFMYRALDGVPVEYFRPASDFKRPRRWNRD
ncbi:transglycosylase domain-containing protein [Microseira wollei]|uniref:1A family penicillin-binding protein n=1 Tax=Microseira wollei NIES-4236 TaxID=2530354 RepID=A0AAV3XJD9_9CYAN|nr:transglycosylase domain-containing protein [Microseira wollei]GET42773.1 1A family penicillin-binding protein [Microseira wollei NIES-4236]